MRHCEGCNQGIAIGVGCTVAVFDHLADGRTRERIPYGGEWADAPSRGPCHDCGVLVGQLHHFRCDMELCPRCGGQAIGCECPFDPSPVPPWEPERWFGWCIDCGIDTVALDEEYMIHDELWPIATYAGTLCVGCVERRIGRELRPEDFTDAPLNHGLTRSARLRARRGNAES